MRVWKGQQAADIRARHPDRFIGSRFVITNKCDEDGERIKARWCLQGHHDPDFDAKIRSGECHSPTLSRLARSLLLQVLVSRKWTMHLGDIKGAFSEAGPIPDKYRPLFAHQPPGGIPGLDPNDVVEILGNLYGANDAPSQPRDSPKACLIPASTTFVTPPLPQFRGYWVPTLTTLSANLGGRVGWLPKAEGENPLPFYIPKCGGWGGGGRGGTPASFPSRSPPPKQPFQPTPTPSPGSHQKVCGLS